MSRLPDPYARETVVVRGSVRVLDAAGAFHFAVDPSYNTGLPDRHATYRGRSLFLEFKRPRGGRLHPKQAWQLARAREAGAVALVVTDPEQVRQALAQIDWEIDGASNGTPVGASEGRTAA